MTPLTDEQAGIARQEINEGTISGLPAHQQVACLGELLAWRGLRDLLPECPTCGGTFTGSEYRSRLAEPDTDFGITHVTILGRCECAGNPVPGRVHPVPYFTAMRAAGDDLYTEVGEWLDCYPLDNDTLTQAVLAAWAALPKPPEAANG